MENDLNSVILGFTNYVANERAKYFNEGLDKGVALERARCAKIADGEIVNGDDSEANIVANQIARTIGAYIRSGGTPDGATVPQQTY